MLESMRKNKVGIIIMLLAAVFACVGQLFWKLASTHAMIVALAGFALYGIGAVLMLLAYRFGSVSVLQPLLGTNYALSVVLGFIVLGEAVTLPKIIGIIIISAGVIFIAGGDE